MGETWPLRRNPYVEEARRGTSPLGREVPGMSELVWSCSTPGTE
jgi:hypothetical protein